MSHGRTIQVYLVDGTAAGLRKVTIHGWTGIVLVSGSATFEALRRREEADRAGVYVLAGPDPRGRGTLAYIGSANSVSERISQSADQRGFWETAYAVTTSDDGLSKGHVEYLEARLIEVADEAGRVILDNSTKPDTSRRRLPEADRANIEQFLDNLRVVLPVAGLEMLKPKPKAAREVEIYPEQRVAGEVIFELVHKSGVEAKAVEEGGEFVVMEGSQALVDTGLVSHLASSKLKESLLQAGVLRRIRDDLLLFAAPHAFSSPSAAAALVLDRVANGRREWRVQGTGCTYGEWQETEAAKNEAAE
ncbi:GIY-YIG nuclease family protein [Jannaschia sp. LMIT008]|uniref:GIY-YIG nuclease family protein n=1 Tax=Jannaschia maritima TaxID=3032585 RepID=UPI0028113365|nr:GIY-YIG nuclease family protein [Jannaschia sp. LMIT008]